MSKRSRMFSTDDVLKSDLEDEISETVIPTPEVPEVPSPPVPSPQTITVDKFVSSKSPIAFAFVRCEKLVHGIRKLTKAEWATEYERFKTQPR